MMAIERSRGNLDDRVQREHCAELARMMYHGVFLVEPLGFDAFWTIEHDFTPYGMTTNPTSCCPTSPGGRQR